MSDALRMTPETLAEAILQAAGSSLRHYTPNSRVAIITAAAHQMALIHREGIPVDLGALQLPDAIGSKDE